MSDIDKLFYRKEIIKKIQQKLPRLFQLAEIDNSRNGRVGMEIGSARERIIIALLIYEFGKENIKTDISIIENEVDVVVFDKPISIKTITNKKIVGAKLIWTVDTQKSINFINNYQSESDMLFVHINWNQSGAIYLISKDTQNEILKKYGKDFYFKLPKQRTNPKKGGGEITGKVINELIGHSATKSIKIIWKRDEIKLYDPYDKWIEL